MLKSTAPKGSQAMPEDFAIMFDCEDCPRNATFVVSAEYGTPGFEYALHKFLCTRHASVHSNDAHLYFC